MLLLVEGRLRQTNMRNKARALGMLLKYANFASLLTIVVIALHMERNVDHANNSIIFNLAVLINK